jgi:hypothetical protein
VWGITGEDPDHHEELLMTNTEAQTIASPIARLFAASELNKRYGRRVLDSNDIVAAVVVAGLYFKRTAPVLNARLGRRPTAFSSPKETSNGYRRSDQQPDVPPGIDPSYVNTDPHW